MPHLISVDLSGIVIDPVPPGSGVSHGYSGYDEFTRVELAAQGIDIPEDVERNRRIDPEEERRIVQRLEARREAAQTLEEQAEAGGPQSDVPDCPTDRHADAGDLHAHDGPDLH